MATSFQRARNDEQRAVRSQAILDTAAAMLEEMPVSELSLNELSRRVGLAKSNVLRYFDSREGILLELLASANREWLAHLTTELPSTVQPRAAFARRAEQLADTIAASLAQRPVLCDLISAQSAVLERNVSVEAITRHKLAGLTDGETLIALVGDALPELDDDAARKYLIAIWLIVASLWTHARPPAALLDAYEAEPRLELHRVEFRTTLSDYLTTLAIGLHARTESR